ncbi:MAG: PAS domain-containing protein [Pseudomonadota bacterium]|nr:PAS domain-containing protein [Pseudomonadota bacterium]
MPLSGTDLLARLIAIVPSPLIVADLTGRILLFNAAAERALGYPENEACGHLHVTDLYHHPEEARRVGRRLRGLTAEGAGAHAQARFDVTLRARNGELIPVRLSASLLRGPDGAECASLGVFEDRREYVALDKRLEDAAVQVETVERRTVGVVAVASAVHEMAQPLTAAMGNVEMLLLETQLPEAVTLRLKRTYDQLERLGAIVSRFARVGRRHPGRDTPLSGGGMAG